MTPEETAMIAKAQESCLKEAHSNQRKFPMIPTIASQDIVSSQDDCLFVDVRTPKERAISIIQGAKTLEDFEKELIDDSSGLPDNKKIVFYCTIGFRSGMQARHMLRRYTDQLEGKVYNLDGIVAYSLALAKNGETRSPSCCLVDPETQQPVHQVHTFGAMWNFAVPPFEAVHFGMLSLLAHLGSVVALTAKRNGQELAYQSGL